MYNLNFVIILKLFFLQKGDIIDVISMNASGIWRGHCNGRVGLFKFVNIEVLADQRILHKTNNIVTSSNRNNHKIRSAGGPVSVDELLHRIGLKEYTSVFVLNG